MLTLVESLLPLPEERLKLRVATVGVFNIALDVEPGESHSIRHPQHRPAQRGEETRVFLHLQSESVAVSLHKHLDFFAGVDVPKVGQEVRIPVGETGSHPCAPRG